MQDQLDCTKFIFANDVEREWNEFPPSVVKYDTINSFKSKRDYHSPQPRYPIKRKLEPDTLETVSLELLLNTFYPYCFNSYLFS